MLSNRIPKRKEELNRFFQKRKKKDFWKHLEKCKRVVVKDRKDIYNHKNESVRR